MTLARSVLEADLLSYPGWGLDGASLHNEIPASGWCVTPQDFRFFRQQIENAVKEGVIAKIPIDPVTGHGDHFDFKDNSIGPNMYNVVCSFLKPLSANAGNMSWALLRNPRGLPCDVFITHAWAEGAYELIDKVLASLPFLKARAWCCILANPQNLNIAHLICEPRFSPFAQALRHCSQMMVVPTQRGSIYKRIWCVYEAHLASTEHKMIYIGRRSAWVKTLLNLGCLAFTMAFFITAAYRLDSDQSLDRHCYAEDQKGHALLLCDWELAVMLAMPILLQVCLRLARLYFSPRSCMAMLVNNVTVILLICCLKFLDGYDNHISFTLVPGLIALLVHVCFSEACRASEEADQQEAQLLAGFSSVVDAEASLQEDKDRILNEIGDGQGDVDFSVHVLLSACLSTPDLRRAALQGVDITGMTSGGVQQALLAVASCAAYWSLMVFLQYFIDVWHTCIVSGVAGLVTFVCWTMANMDRKPFIASSFVLLQMLQNLIISVVALQAILKYTDCSHISRDTYTESPPNMEHLWDCIGPLYASVWTVRILSIIFLPMMICCCLGPHRLGQLPFLGAWLAGMLGPGRVVCPRRIDAAPHRKDARVEHSQATV